jgi:predicted hydrocarbon binding protein
MSTISKQKTAMRTNKCSLDKGVLFSFETISEIESALEEILSPSAASMILCTIAKKSGVNSCRKIMKKARTKEKMLNYLSKLKNDDNWGRLSLQNIDFANGSGKIIIIKSFESIARKTIQPCCQLFRGFLEGSLSELFGKNITITEEKCAGKGDKHCKFVFG